MVRMMTVVGIVAVGGVSPIISLSAQTPEPFSPFEPHAYRLVNSIAFSPSGSEMYYALFAREVRAYRGESAEGAPEVGLYRSTWEGSRWSAPEVVTFTGRYHTYEPTISPDGRVMVFNSARPYPDGRTPERNDLWMSERTNGEWGSPRRIAEISTFDAEESYGALGGDGTLVFLKEVEIAGGSPHDLYESRYLDGHFQPPTRHPVSSDRWGEGDPWLSPDGRTLIFTRWDDEVGWSETVDLYIATRDADGWSEPEPLRELNTEGADFGVASSPDGRWLYYKNGSTFMRVDLESALGPYRAPAL
jgi:WD40-like Beta Propeller Repeat